MSPSLPISASFPYCTGTIPHHCVTPHAALARQPLEALDLLLASVALLGVAVPAHPVVRWNLNEGNGRPHERAQTRDTMRFGSVSLSMLSWRRWHTPVSFLDLTYVLVQGAGFLFAQRPWTVYLQPAHKTATVSHFGLPFNTWGVDGETGGG